MRFVFLIAIALVGLTACGSGSDNSENTNTLNGTFIGQVKGLSFKTATQSGVTDSTGKFTYQEGETVTFSIGNIILGEAQGKPKISPIDLVATAQNVNDQTVINIIRLLHTLDSDKNPDNGISIIITSAITNLRIDFTVSQAEFEANGTVSSLIASAGNSSLISESEAQRQFLQSLQGSDANNLSGIWIATTVTGENTCGDPVGESSTQSTFIVQHGNQATLLFKFDEEKNVSSTFDGTTISVPAFNILDDGGTTSIKASIFTLSENKTTLQGSVNWTWTNGENTCSGLSTLTSVREITSSQDSNN